MNEIMEFFRSLKDYSLLTVAVRLLLAVVLGGMLGLERERHGRAAGLRTHILVCLGSATACLVGVYTTEALGLTSDPMRVSAQVISGIGFLGVGTILSKGRFQVTGLTTAAGLWTTAAIGLAVGIGFYEGALISTFLAALTMSLLSRFDKRVISRNKKFSVYIETNDVANVSKLITELREQFGAKDLQVTVPRSGISNNAGIEVSVNIDNGLTQQDVIDSLTRFDAVIFALPSI